mmetsp:Transcript_10929/g.26473  ORF Transcript_10929/g.26473 Transcript_10929/m.26473 type:complete len:239 (+) Transcript_10929:148-864(+)
MARSGARPCSSSIAMPSYRYLGANTDHTMRCLLSMMRATSEATYRSDAATNTLAITLTRRTKSTGGAAFLSPLPPLAVVVTTTAAGSAQNARMNEQYVWRKTSMGERLMSNLSRPTKAAETGTALNVIRWPVVKNIAKPTSTTIAPTDNSDSPPSTTVEDALRSFSLCPREECTAVSSSGSWMRHDAAGVTWEAPRSVMEGNTWLPTTTKASACSWDSRLPLLVVWIRRPGKERQASS